MTDNTQTLPPLYKDPKPLIASEHADLKMKPFDKFDFAKDTNSIIVTLTEVPAAALSYPVVFANFSGEIMPVGILGMDSNKNSMINEDGSWREGTYIPAYIRRYPFIFMENSEDDKLTLCVDMECEVIGTDDGEPIFDGDEATDTTKRILEFCEMYNRELAATKPLCKAIEDAGLLEEKEANVQRADNTKASITGFLVINEQSLNELSDDEFLKLRSSGALPLVYSHLLSMRSWNNLLK